MFQADVEKEDLDHILTHAEEDLKALQGQKIFLTGATGFFGKWLIQGLAHAHLELSLDLELHLLSRNWESFNKKFPKLIDNNFMALHTGDVRSFNFPEAHCQTVIHAATEASVQFNKEHPDEMFDTIKAGTQRVLDYCTQAKTHNILLMSSGAVYGPQAFDISHVKETDSYNIPENKRDAYAEGKRFQEELSLKYQAEHEFKICNARGFAFTGAHLPLDRGFAAGNFINDAIHGKSIEILGDGTPLRSYLYTSDLIIWFLRMLNKGTHQAAYNVGSDESVSIEKLAHCVAQNFNPKTSVNIHQKPKPDQPVSRYVPSIEKAKTELGLKVFTPLDRAIEKTVKWYRDRL